ncbi:Uncharacterized protein SCF082_LOCUS17633 [Durusdinium trenchii]|uniref:EF-hand domain-containing protein n=2 Tax=Durusdinium trenchii TaxID=1381693 RepID=A0ABP0KIT8_9DINO
MAVLRRRWKALVPTLLTLLGQASLLAAMSEPGPGGPKSMAEKVMESAEYASAVKAMSEVMAKAEEEARDFVVEKAEELGEDGALEAALMEAFVAFDSDNDGKLIGQELAVLLEVSGRTVPPELLQEFQSKDFECDYDEFTRIYARTWRNEHLEDDEEFEGSDEV